jgi:signal transduction histidine kinase
MTMSDPIAKLCHDLANPLAAILAETQLMLLGDEPMPDEVRQGLQEIEKLSLRMRTILRETQTPPRA